MSMSCLQTGFLHVKGSVTSSRSWGLRGTRVASGSKRTTRVNGGPVTSKRAYHGSSSVHVDAHVHAFGRLIKAAVADKQVQVKKGTKDEFMSKAGEEEKDEFSFINAKHREAGDSIEQERTDVRTAADLRQESNYELNIARQQAALDASLVHANDPCFSERARAKAYDLHKQNKDFWNPARLANLFRVSLATMRISLWASGMEEQAASEGVDLDDTCERLLAQKYGELDFPGEIADVPHRIRWTTTRDLYFFLDGEVKSAELMKGLRNRGMVHYRESPRLPKRSIPPVEDLEPNLGSRNSYRVVPGKFTQKFVMWDVSPQKDLYTRRIVVREKDGSFRSGNWQDRRYAEDYRKTIKWPMKVPHVRPDEDEPDHVPSYARVPDGFKVTFDKNTTY